MTRFLRNAKRAYLNNLLDSADTNRPDELWRALNIIINRNQSRIDDIQIIQNSEILEGQQLADALNSYFVNLVKSSHDERVRTCLTNPNEHGAFFPTSENEIRSNFAALGNSNARYIDGCLITAIEFDLDCILPALNHKYN